MGSGHRGLSVQRQRIVHDGGDPGGPQPVLQGFAIGHPDRVLRIHADVVWFDMRRGLDSPAAEQLSVPRRHLLAHRHLLIED
ncbi:hypothetical protein D3C72_1792350 [compost metagenome]